MKSETPGVATTEDRLADSKFTEWSFQSSRPDRTWENEEATNRRELWSITQSELAAELAKIREGQNINARLAEVMRRIELRAMGYTWNEHGSGLEVEWMSAHQLTKHLVAAAIGDIDAIHHIRILEQMLDGQRQPGNQIRLTSELNNRILELEGLSPEQISVLDPQLGSPKVVRYVRRQADLNTENGQSKRALVVNQ